jgi:cytolethal distending toxin subunit A
MIMFPHPPASLVASGAFAFALFFLPGTMCAEPIGKEVMLVNAKTGKCATVAGGETTANNHPTVQFTCDSDASRRWRLNEVERNIYQIRNAKTGKCLTIAGGETDANSHPSVQFDCDSHPSRTWRIDDVRGNGIHQLRNVRTGKCLTIRGDTLPDNNLPLVQFNCDDDQSRRWTIRLKL